MNDITREELFRKFAGSHIPAKAIDWLANHGYFTAPASARYHGAYAGGLFDHSYEVAKQLVRLTDAIGLVWQNDRSPYVVGLLHDACKIDQYRFDYTKKYGGKPKIAFVYDTPIIGHGSKSVVIVSSLLQLTDEEAACIFHHMGAFGERKAQNAYSAAVNKYENVLWTHTADMIASQVKGV